MNIDKRLLIKSPIDTSKPQQVSNLFIQKKKWISNWVYVYKRKTANDQRKSINKSLLKIKY
jgi:hypothetical protein